VKVKAPKVRTGCITCRKRRVKCDEGKPKCARCLKFGVACDGYQTKPLKGPRSTKKRLLFPKTQDLEIELEFLLPRFSEEVEGQYFRYYCDEIAFQIQGPFRTGVWDRLIPQAGEMQPFIRHAIVALGALSKAYAEDEHPILSNPHHMYALKAYCKALKGIRNVLCSGWEDGRNALIACLLVFCFESLQGHQAAATMHAGSLVSLFFNWRWASEGTRDNTPGVCAHGIQIEEGLHVAFSELDLQALLFLDQRSTTMHRQIKEDVNITIGLMPGQFETMHQCRAYWQLIMRRNFHFVAAARAAVSNPLSCINVEGAGPEESYTRTCMRPENNPLSNTTNVSSRSKIPSYLLDEQQRYVKDIRRWERATESIFSRPTCQVPHEGDDLQDFSQATLLKIHSSMNVVLLARTFYPPETGYDIYLPEFRKQVELCGIVAPYIVFPNQSARMYRFDLGIIPSLSQTGVLCRHSQTRGRAIALLEACRGYREGIWDGKSIAVITGFIRDAEEENGGLDENGWVKVGRRVRLQGVDINAAEKMATISVKEASGRERVGHLRW
jgi:hypothetical protein